MRRAALVFNPAAGSGAGARRLARIVAELRGGYALEVQESSSAARLSEIARSARAGELAALFVLGGDGSLRLAAAELAGGATALAPLPGGTTNVVARALGLPLDPLAAARQLVGASETRELDLGRVGGEVFLMQVSGGLDACVMAAVDPRWKRRLGPLAIAWTGLRELARYRFPPYQLDADGERLAATGFVAANLAEYAGGFRIVPGASAEDGRLELLLFRGRRRRDAAGFALALARGRHCDRADVELRVVTRLTVTGPDPLALQADGDPLRAASPLEIGLAASRLRVLAPARAHPSARPPAAPGAIASRP